MLNAFFTLYIYIFFIFISSQKSFNILSFSFLKIWKKLFLFWHEFHLFCDNNCCAFFLLSSKLLVLKKYFFIYSQFFFVYVRNLEFIVNYNLKFFPPFISIGKKAIEYSVFLLLLEEIRSVDARGGEEGGKAKDENNGKIIHAFLLEE